MFISISFQRSHPWSRKYLCSDRFAPRHRPAVNNEKKAKSRLANYSRSRSRPSQPEKTHSMGWRFLGSRRPISSSVLSLRPHSYRTAGQHKVSNLTLSSSRMGNITLILSTHCVNCSMSGVLLTAPRYRIGVEKDESFSELLADDGNPAKAAMIAKT